MKLLTEIERIQSMMSIITEQDEEMGPRMDRNLRSVVETLQFLKLYGNKIENMLMDISQFATTQIIDLSREGLEQIPQISASEMV